MADTGNLQSKTSDWLNSKNNFYKFIAILAVFKLIIIALIPITPQEAYYWYYSQNPDLSYFDHPPMAAYSIWFGTTLFGNTIFGVKFMAVVWSLLTNILLYKITVRYLENKVENDYKYKTAFTVVILYNLTIFANMYSIIIVPDTPLLFFWLMIVYSIHEFSITQKRIWWVIAGACFGFSLVSKYSGIIILGSIFLYLIFSREHRKILLTPYPYLAVVLGAIVFSPVIYWNASHEWASLKFQFIERAQKQKSVQLTYLIQLFFSQVLLLTPLVFGYFIKGIIKFVKEFKTSSGLNLFFFGGIVIIAVFTYTSLTALVKMNWLMPGYLSLLVLVVVMLKIDITKRTVWMKIGAGVSILLVVTGYSVLLIPNVPLGEGNTWSGWEDAAVNIYELQQERGGEGNCFLFGNSYKSASLLKFYLPDQQNTYAENIYGKRGLQFDYWGIPDDLIGKDALYVFSNRREYKNNLEIVRNYFEKVTLLKEYKYSFFGGKETRVIYCYEAKNYFGL